MAGISRVLIVGSSYGLLVAAKAAMAGVSVTLVGRQPEVDAINTRGIHVKILGRKPETVFDLHSKSMKGDVSACVPGQADPSGHDLIILAMQEPHYAHKGMRELTIRMAGAGKPCLSLMNMPPPPYLRRFRSLDKINWNHCYSDVTVWEGFDPKLFTHASPDPQAYRPVSSQLNFLQVGLSANFRTADFQDRTASSQLQAFSAEFNNARMSRNGRQSSVPVRLKIRRSAYVPFSKWSMLLAGNYRCIQPNGPQSIKNAVHGDLATTRRIYQWVNSMLEALGADPSDLVPFEQYANSALSLVRPSSAAQALFNGATEIERVDRLVHVVARSIGLDTGPIDEIIRAVDSKLEATRRSRQKNPA